MINFKLSRGFPGSSDGKESACNARDPGWIPGSGRPPGKGYLGNAKDTGPWRATVHGGHRSSYATERLNTFTSLSDLG